jgi:MFS family permease
MPAWSLAVLCQRLPVAAAPLALVYAGQVATGSYAVGALLAGVFALAEAVVAGPMGRRFDRHPAGPELRWVLAVQAVALLVIGAVAVLAVGAAPVWALIALTAVAGGITAGAHGGLRALLLRSVDPAVHTAALSLEATATTLLWAVGPALVGLAAVLAGPAWPIVGVGLVAALGTVAATVLRDPGPGAPEPATTEVRVWRRSWPALLQEGAVLMCVGGAYAALPPLFALLGTDPDLAGPVLGAFAAVGIAGGLLYGSRAWRGSFATQSAVLVLAVAVATGAAAVAPTALVVAALLLAAGSVGTPALTARASGVQELLPARCWATGFSGLYAAGGVGFGLAGLLSAALLESAGPRAALLVCAGLAAVAAVVGAMAERRVRAGLTTRSRSTGRPS